MSSQVGLSTPSEVDLIIVAPPFATIMMPMLGPSILAAQCRDRGISTSVEYSGLRLAQLIGLSLYERIGLSSFSLMLGDLLFRQFAFPDLDNPLNHIASYFSKHALLSTSSTRFGAITFEEAKHALDAIEPFVRVESERILTMKPRIVGFSTVFQQNLPSMALARYLKCARPDVITVIGGANAAYPMGAELIRVAGCFDHAFSGEADFDFPNFVGAFIASQERHTPKAVIECRQVRLLDSVAQPSFHDYYEQLADAELEDVGVPRPGDTLPIETSRGCWWGSKHHCTFCGLNGQDMAFRTKSPNRVACEIDTCFKSYKVRSFQATDNIMSSRFPSTVLPLLSRLQPLDMFFEVKSNINEADLDQFVFSGVNTIQPGIESFSTAVLKRIEKGVTGIRNVWLLRECASRRIAVTWNLLVDVPGEMEEDLIVQVELLPALSHLQPPNGLSRIVVDRFSPYFNRPSAFGIDHVRPLSSYAALYPPATDIARIAYHFEAEYESAYRRSLNARTAIEDAVTSWRKCWQLDGSPPKLYITDLDNGRAFVEDTRSVDRPKHFALESGEVELLGSFRKPRRASPVDYEEGLGKLFDRRLVVELDGLVVSIVTEPRIGFDLQKQRLKAIAGN